MNTLASYQPRSAWAMASMLTWLSLINFLDKIVLGMVAVPLMAVELIALLLFMAAGVYYAPFADANSWIAIGVGMLGVLTMSVQNAGSRTTFLHLGPTTVMTGNVTQIVIDLVDLMTGVAAPETRERIGKTWPPVAGFAIGAVGGGLCYWLAGFWSLLVPAVALGFLLLRLCAAGR